MADMTAMQKGGAGASAAAGIATGIAGAVPSQGGKGANIAAQSLFTASAAANAIPVAGQFVSAGLAIAGMFVKIFAGKKKKKREEAKKRQEAKMSRASTSIKAGVQADASGGVGTASGQAVGATAPVSGPAAPSFSSWGGGSAPSVQPVQQALNNKTGM